MRASRKAALVTGGASGIGKAICLELARSGYSVTVVDTDHKGTAATVGEIQAAGGTAHPAQVDVCSDEEQQAVFEEHMARYGQLHVAVLNAGVAERGDFATSDGNQWQTTLDVNLRAVMVGTRLAVRCMTHCGCPGAIMITASASAFFPIPSAPVYSASKAGVVQFVRSISPGLHKQSIRVTALCPEYVATPLVTSSAAVQQVAQSMSKGAPLLTVEQVVEAGMYLVNNEAQVGTCLVVRSSGDWYEWVPKRDNLRLLKPSQAKRTGPAARQPTPDPALVHWACQNRPQSRATVQVHRLLSNFREATQIVNLPLPASLPPGHVLVRRAYAGINASDVNYTAGRYYGSPQEAAKRLPFESGFESVGVVAALGPDVSDLRVGQPVAQLSYDGFADYAVVPAEQALPVPVVAPEVLALLTSGLTASIGLEQAGRMRTGETVLVTAAAGGTGQFAVQLAKGAGNHVIATCSSPSKVALLKRLGADRVINYKEESLKAVLRKEYPRGVNLIYESVGGEMFKTCTQALATKGRLVIIGMMSQYKGGWTPLEHAGLPEALLWKGATLTGFFLLHHMAATPRHLARLMAAWRRGALQVAMDPTPFKGLASVAQAVDHLQSGNSIGKVFVQLAEVLPSVPTARL